MLSCLRILTAASLAAAATGAIGAASAASAAERPGRPAADFSCSRLVLSTSGLARGIAGCRPEKAGARASGDIHGTFTVRGFVPEKAKPVTVTCRPDPDLPADPSGAYVHELFGFHCS
ncbi:MULTISPECIES: hypothetical protein [Actinomadura]|uniref:Secreted protein n=2 Tax=Actinomadura TaxID=1988 RepID=A0A7D3VXR2_ACTVE|nr:MULTISPECIES: hypothetical protein [Actinomadura]MBO2463218.1 hypothetical protein [Actinomadura violacea]QKG21591.1 hypothetical protein ACTIVE_3229 [Actinomadura verrucosospora]